MSGAAVSEAFAFRCAELADVAAITALIRRAFEVHVAGLGRVPRPMLADYREVSRAPDVNAERLLYEKRIGSEPR